MKNRMGKLFGVLVVGGSMMAQANEIMSPPTNSGEKCQLEVVSKKYSSLDGSLFSSDTTCVDTMDHEEILQLIESKRNSEPPQEPCTWGICGGGWG